MPSLDSLKFMSKLDTETLRLNNVYCRWSIIAAQLPGRTDNDIKNYWNTKLKKKLMGIINQPGQRKPHFSTNINISSSSSSSSYSSSPLPSHASYGSHYSQAVGGSYTTGFDPMAAFSTISLSSPTTSGSFLQHQVSTQESLLSQMQQHYQVKDSSSSGGLIMFGAGGGSGGGGHDQASCSSSDGSCNNNQIGHGRSGTCNNYHNGVVISQEDQKAIISDGNFANGWGISNQASFLEYGLEEIKQLISSTSTTCNNNNNDNFLFDENKTEERVLYYY